RSKFVWSQATLREYVLIEHSYRPTSSGAGAGGSTPPLNGRIRAPASHGEGDSTMLKKQYLKRGTVKVDFVLPPAVAAEATSAYLVGDFNNWDETATPMNKLKNGSF